MGKGSDDQPGRAAAPPPARFAEARFATYRPQTPSQREALEAVQAFVEEVRARQRIGARMKRAARKLVGGERPHQGVYLVGPVGTGKTHLLASAYAALEAGEPHVPCAFLHASQLFRLTEHPAAFAHRLAEEVRFVCLDEVEIDDAANEARLVLILRTLEEEGVLLLATSNVEPEAFLSQHTGGHRFRRFLQEEFRRRYRVVFVGGEDFRRGLQKPGVGFIGPRKAAREALRAAYEADEAEDKRWLPFAEFLRLSTETEHSRLVRSLVGLDALYLDGIDPQGTDDALRLLKVIDDLYLADAVPVLHVSAPRPPEMWFSIEGADGAVGRGIAEKFERTVSRIRALCAFTEVISAETLEQEPNGLA